MGKVEQNLQTKILQDLNSMGKHCVAFDVMKCSEDGVPDVYFTTVKTGSVWVEVKKPDGVWSKKQQEMCQRMHECGTRSYVAWLWSDWVKIKKELGLDVISNSIL